MSFFGSGSNATSSNRNFSSKHSSSGVNSSSSISSSQQQFGNFNALVSAAGADGFAWDNNTAVDSDGAAMSPITDTIAANADAASTTSASSSAFSALNLLADNAIDHSNSSNSSSASSSLLANGSSKHPERRIVKAKRRPTQQGH
jgi:hypothetical protein